MSQNIPDLMKRALVSNHCKVLRGPEVHQVESLSPSPPSLEFYILADSSEWIKRIDT